MLFHGVLHADFRGLDQADAARDALARDIKRCAVVHRPADERKSPCDGDGFLEVQRLAGDVTMVVIHGKDRVKLSGFADIEDRVTRDRADRVDAFGLRRFHSREQLVDLFSSEESVISVVRIDTGDSNQRILDPDTLQFIVDIAEELQDDILRRIMHGIDQGHMPADEEHAELVAGEHGQRIG